MTHTPGPWTYSDSGYVFGTIDIEQGRRLIAGVRTHHMDARLISAAPDLLEALLDVIYEWEVGTVKMPTYLRKEMQLAINKAKGL